MIVCAPPGDEEQSNYDLRSQLRLGKEKKEEEKDIVGAERGIRETFTSCGIFRVQRREASEPRFFPPIFLDCADRLLGLIPSFCLRVSQISRQSEAFFLTPS
jgi:hypothetical protein